MANSTARPRALVTGASSGIGLIYAERLAQQGYDLILVARRRDRLTQLADRLHRSNGIIAEVVCADLADPKGLADLEARLGDDDAISLLINNAGFGGYQPFASIPPKVMDDLIGVHISAVVHLTRAALPGMIKRGKGAIINVASLLAINATSPPNPLPWRATYAGAKAFMLAFTQALAGELAGTGVQVQACLPGRVSTEFHTVQGIDISKLPPAMTAEEVVTASLMALARGEVVCVPALEEAALFNELAEMGVNIFRTCAAHPTLAERYRST